MSTTQHKITREQVMKALAAYKPTLDDAALSRKVDIAKVQLCNSEGFQSGSGMIHLGELKLADIPTAATNGESVILGRAFMSQLNQKQFNWVVAHETIGHNMNRHLQMYRDLFEEDAECANKACDHVANLIIAECDPDQRWVQWESMPLPAIVLLDKKYTDWTVRQVYADLRSQKPAQSAQGGKGAGGGQSGQGEPDEGDDFPGGFDEHDTTSASDPESVMRIEKMVDTALRMSRDIAARRAQGTGAGRLDRIMGAALEPTVDWRQVLADYVSAHCKGNDNSTFARPRRRFIDSGVILPSSFSESVEALGVFVDTSGSIDDRQLQEVMSHMLGICRAGSVQKMLVVYWDDGVRSVEEYDTVDDEVVRVTKPKGGGGTSFAPVLQHMEKRNIRINAGVCFTDGYISDWGDEPAWPMLWVLTTDVRPPWGVTVKMDR